MSLLTQVQADALTARKEKNEIPRSLLVTLGSEMAMVGKNANRETTDEESLAVIRKFLKGINEVLNIRPGDAVALEEKRLLEAYLPQQMSEEKLRSVILEIARDLHLEKITAKDTGAIMKVLSAQYAGQYQGANASALIKSLLA